MLRATGLAGLLALAGWMPAAGQEGAEARVNVDRLNFREECGMSAPVLGVLTRDETVTVLGEELGGWVRVRDEEGVEGCVSAEYLAIDETTVTDSGTMSSPTVESEPYGWADLTDPDSAEIVAEIEELEAELAATSDPDEQEDLRQEITELEDDLRVRQEELADEREAAVQEARERDLAAREAQGGEAWQPRSTGRRVRTDRDWTGFYLGVNAGYGFGDEVSAFNSLGTSPEGDVDGFDGGVQVGYSHQARRYVFGAEADYQLSNQSGSSDLQTIGFPGSSIELQYNSFGTVRIRGGVTVGRALLFATGGYAYSEAEASFSGPIADLVPEESANLTGWTVGIGIERILTSGISLKAEALSLEFDEEPEFEDIGRSEFYSARVGLNWQF